MRRTMLGALLIALLVGEAARCQEQAPAELRPYYFPGTRFVLPMTPPQGNALRVELLLSSDQGRSWQAVDAIDYRNRRPTADQFTVQTRSDGHYWFAVRTYFPRHQDPTGAPKPEIHVVLDSQQPELVFRVLAGGRGELVAQWEAEDVNLDPGSLRIEYKTGSETQWIPVSHQAPQATGSGQASGETTWWPRSAAEGVTVRAEIRDKAGNRRQVQQWHPLAKIAAVPDRLATSSSSSSEREESGAIRWPADRMTPESQSPHPPAVAQATPPRSEAVEENPQTSPPLQAGGWSSRDPSAIASRPASSPVQPPVTQRGPNATPISRTLISQLPEGDRPSMTNSKRFEFDYDVDAVGRDGVARLELYRTSDAGRTWTLDRELENPDPREPLRVEVANEGMYGYRVVVIARNGFASRRPAPGDQADLWVGVDLTSPEIRLTGAVYGKGDQAGKLVIRWDGHDALFGDRPIALRFSESPDGPWSTIASGLPNTGEYLWAADPRTPEQIFLRIEARDAAGNTAADQLERPIRIEGLVPRGRIRSFRPIRSGE